MNINSLLLSGLDSVHERRAAVQGKKHVVQSGHSRKQQAPTTCGATDLLHEPDSDHCLPLVSKTGTTVGSCTQNLNLPSPTHPLERDGRLAVRGRVIKKNASNLLW